MSNIQDDVNKMLKKTNKKKRINSYRKGSTFERKISKSLTESLGVDVVRVPMSGAFSSTNVSDMAVGDLMTPKKNTFFPYCFECKHHDKHNVVLDVLNKTKKNNPIPEWIDQCENDAKRDDKFPMVIFQLNRSQIFLIFQYGFRFKNPSSSRTFESDSPYFQISCIKNKKETISFFHNNEMYMLMVLDNFDFTKHYKHLNQIRILR